MKNESDQTSHHTLTKKDFTAMHLLQKLLLFGVAFSIASSLFSDEFIVGATTHFNQSKGDVSANLSVFKQAGMTSLRDDIVWGSWEKKRGVYAVPQLNTIFIQQALKDEISPLQVICSHNQVITPGYPITQDAIGVFAKCAAFVAEEFKGRCKFYQIWNEWDQGTGIRKEFQNGNNASNYVNLLAATYPLMKKADPECTVIANSATSVKFLEETFQLGVLKHCDGYAFHLYLFGFQGQARQPEAYLTSIKKVVELSKRYNNGIAKPLYLTEAGWPNHGKIIGTKERDTADYLARTYLLIRTVPEVKGLWWYDFQDDGYRMDEQEENFGLVTPDLTPKEQYYVMRSIAPVIRDAKFIRRIESPDQDLWIFQYRMPDGEDVIAAWTPKDHCRKQLIFERGAAPDSKLYLQVAGFDKIERRWGFREWSNAATNRRSCPPNDANLFAFSVSTRPVLLYGQLEGAKLLKVNHIKRPPFDESDASSRLLHVAPMGELEKWIAFGGNEHYFRVGGMPAIRDDNDLNAAFRVSESGQDLRIEVEVSDDKHVQHYSPEEMWNGDNVQVAIASFQNNAVPKCGSEYSFGLTDKGPVVFRLSSELDSQEKTSAQLNAIRKEGKTIYDITIPLQELGIKSWKPGSPIGFSIVVNENDHEKRQGFLTWGGGIAAFKYPAEYNWIIKPSSGPAAMPSVPITLDKTATRLDEPESKCEIGFSEKNNTAWKLALHNETTGNLTWLKEAGPDGTGAAKLNFSYSNRKGVGGIVINLHPKQNAPAFRITMKNPSYNHLVFRVGDDSGQSLQWSVKVTPSEEWQTVEFPFRKGYNLCNWGGANNKEVNGKIKWAAIYFEPSGLSQSMTGSILLNKIEVIQQ